MDTVRNSILFVLLILASTLSTQTCSHLAVQADLQIIRVPIDYPTIQGAIDAASFETMILVSNGVYHEHLALNKTLKLIGMDRTGTIIDADGTGTVVTVAADNVLINGFTIRNGSSGIHITQSNNITVSGNTITENDLGGVSLEGTSHSLVFANTVSSSRGLVYDISQYGLGVGLSDSHYNTIDSNVITNCTVAIELVASDSDLVVRNNVIENSYFGIFLDSSGRVDHNSFINNGWLAGIESNTIWDDGREGNYWDDYVGLDDGSNGRVAGDGVGDTDLPHLYLDDYPLISPPQLIPVMWEDAAYSIALVSNSTVSSFRFVQAEKKIAFNVRGPLNTTGHFNATIPTNLLRDSPWKITLNNGDVTSQATIKQNQTHTCIQLNYNHNSSYDVQIFGTWVIPEFSTHNLLVLILWVTLVLATMLGKNGKRLLAMKHFAKS